MEKARIRSGFEGQVLRVHARPGDKLSSGAELLSIRLAGASIPGSGQSLVEVPAFRSYTVDKLLLAPGEQVSKGDVIAEVTYCTHPTAFKNLCALCGESVEESNEHLEHDVIVAGGQNLSLSASAMQAMGKHQHDALKAQRKLALIIDLDHTVLHATAAPRQCDVEQYQDTIHRIEVNERGRREIYTIKTRPGLQQFFDELSSLYRITIYTHGTRSYAESVAHVLDPRGMLFGQRIVSRTDTPNLQTSKSLRKIFPSDPSMALIIDDRDDVWEGPQGMHLLLVRPYSYFKSAPEVNNVSGQQSLQQAASNEGDQQEDQPAIDENDGYLGKIAHILKDVHKQYYERFDQLSSMPEAATQDVRADAAMILQQCYKQALQGVKILFSGLIPTTVRDPSSHQLWRYAEKLGATVVGSVEEATHLVTANTQTEKARQAISAGDVFVVHADWLLHCLWRLRRVDERRFSLAEAPRKPKLPFAAESVDDTAETPSTTTSAGSEPASTSSAAAAEESKTGQAEGAKAAAAPKRLKLTKRRRDNGAKTTASQPSKAASSPPQTRDRVVELFVQIDGSHSISLEPQTSSFGDDVDTIALQQDYEEAARISHQVQVMGKKAAATEKAKAKAEKLLDYQEQPGPVDDPESFPEDRVRRRSIDYTNDRIIANDFEYGEWPPELVDYYQSVGKGAGGHVDDHDPNPEPPLEDENDYQEIFDNQFADESSEGYVLAARTEAPDASNPDQMLRGDGTDVRIKAARGTSSPRKRDRNFPDVPAETAKRTRHVATESPATSDDSEMDEWVNQMEQEIQNASPP